ncbi:hypothetical protein F7725_015118 [Dissostichus mawsoni]|uniref:Uncharacterized protein n=1 Tax=Dissostichus mawsoni TaxID=36200 RepID=A0A7J5YI19_DISMA|nr:hypothetical protein F7725_015118 [Dissostichus mawsoni]
MSVPPSSITDQTRKPHIQLRLLREGFSVKTAIHDLQNEIDLDEDKPRVEKEKVVLVEHFSLTCEPLLALADVSSCVCKAQIPVQIPGSDKHVHIFLTRLPLEARCTAALKALSSQQTRAIVPAGFIDAVGHVCPAVLSSEAFRTSAEVSVQLVHTQGLGLRAGVTLTLVHLLCAVITCHTIRADAVILCFPRGAGAVSTWSEGAGVIQFFAVFAHVSNTVFGTDTGVVVHVVHTGSCILAGCRETIICSGVAEYS